ncbi:hypothetical protein FisN_26Lh017 [Fistulifera solaris]|uniref:Oxidation resistance protein 1 n=1 Tax=Fistulifera solaris TaxID=1519565 RepID=A0A1Z5KCD3_FISSO|nr:hypothetical protein FisN_26Lh017 [Fistulifera solaris]|eukprot:GAX23960.1 hypothetical protein FisN_26Lh017 [Fistulifera solaris]
MTRPIMNEEGSPFFADLTTLHTLQERYPFTEAELEILVRCHEHLYAEEPSFLVKLATASPYSVFFLPDYTAVDRVTWLEEHVLPLGFSHQLHSALLQYADYIPSSLERFLEGIANTGRRVPQEALRVLYRCVEGSIDPEAAVADLVVRLALATALWHRPQVPETEVFVKEVQDDYQPTIHRITNHLRNFTNRTHEQRNETKSSHITSLTERIFIKWAEEMFPLLYLTLTSLVESLLFHGLHANVEESTMHANMALPLPELNLPSEIFTPSIVMPLAWIDPSLSGKFHRLYSSFHDGRSFNRLEYGILGYEGPTCVMIQTTANAVLGVFTNARWRACRDTSGHTNDEAFLFTFQPALNVYRPCPKGERQHLWYLYSQELDSSNKNITAPEGLGWGGTSEMPRLWIPASLERCHAGGWDKTFQLGPLLPDECCERFEIKYLEVWAVGGEERIEPGLAKQAMFRQQTKEALQQARVVLDKREFVNDLQQMPLTKVFQHQALSRGRHDFVLDEKHGGYKIEE